MDMLKREMERKRKALQEGKQKLMIEQSNSSSSEQHRSRRYMKTSEVRRILEEEASITKTRTATSATVNNDVVNHSDINPAERQCDTNDATFSSTGSVKKQKLNHADEAAANFSATSSRRNDDGVNSDTLLLQKESQSTQQKEKYTLVSVQRELRLLGLPITYFGEKSIAQRKQRLEQAQNHQSIMQLQEREADEFRLKQGFGIRNTYLEKDTNDLEEIQADFHNTNSNENDNDRTSSKNRKLKVKTDAGSSKNDQDHKRDASLEVEDQDDMHKRIYKHFKGLLKQWENDLNGRSDDVKRALAGRNETKKVKQCKDYIRPLFQLCKRRQLDENMVQKLYAMVLFCEQGEFVRAHDAYMDIAIGRAAWPIGVTMVGIHARTGRAKIESSNVAHVMNSELQRKYLTSVKRLLTYEQNQRTDVDPSKKVR